jgi:hypothetical protein
MPVLTEDAGFDFGRLEEGFPSSVTITRVAKALQYVTVRRMF